MKILSLNLTATMSTPRAERLGAVADFVRENEVDVLLVQEGIRSCFIYNTIRALAGELGFDYAARSSFGIPLFWEFRVGVLSRFKILRTASLDPAVPQTEMLDRFPLPWRKRAVASTVDVQGLGITTLISVHLTSSAKTAADKAKELELLAAWRRGLPESDAVIWGGDLNFDFDVFPIGAKYGVAPDYIFVEGAARIIDAGEVLTGHEVTDHKCGVLVEVGR